MNLSPEQITALGKVAPWFIIAIAIAIVIVLNWKNVGFFFKKLKKVNYKGLNVESGADETEEKEIEDLQEEQAELPEEEGEEQNPRKEPETKKEWEFEMIYALISEELDNAEKARDHLISISENREEEDKYNILFLEWKTRITKDLGCISSIEKYTNSDEYPNQTIVQAYAALADIKTFLEDFEKSNEYLDKAISLSEDNKVISKYEIEKAANLHRDGRKQDAFEMLEGLLVRYPQKELQKNIYEEIAHLYKSDEDQELAALATEKMIECGKEDSEAYFSAAYAYSDVKLEKLSLLHYKKALKLGKSPWALNNIGVQYDNLGMPIKSMEAYDKSIEKDNTLAAANRAYRLMDAGFIKEAKELLNQAKDKEDVHPNVHTALASIAKKEEAEEEKEKKIVEDAKQQKDFMRDYASKYFTKAEPKKAQGDFKIYGKYEAKVSVNKGKILITWEKPGFTEGFFYDQKIEGTLHNNACKVIFYDSKVEGGFEKDTEGYLYIESEAVIKIAKQNSYNKQNYEISEIVKV